MALRRFLFSIATWAFVLAIPAYAYAQDPPLFAAFKSFCLDAGADADQVKLAVQMAGGKPHNPPGGSTTTPWPMTATSWDIAVQGHRMILNIGTAHPPGRSGTTDCILTSFSDETASIAALRKWVGIPKSHGDQTVEFYDFDQDGSVRKLGNSWHMAILSGANSFQFTHDLPPTPGKPG
jgi:hypothetical protein